MHEQQLKVKRNKPSERARRNTNLACLRWYYNHKDDALQYRKWYYSQHRDKIIKQVTGTNKKNATIRIRCRCGAEIMKRSLAGHEKSHRHLSTLNDNLKLSDAPRYEVLPVQL